MAKREAGDQLTRENYNNNSDEDEQVENTMASSEVMNRRKIAMPKRKMAFSNKMTNGAAKAESSFANAFNFTKKSKSSTIPTDDDKPAKLKALNEQYKNKIVSILASDPCSDLSPLFSKYTQYLNDINGVTSKDKPITSTASPFSNPSGQTKQINPKEPKPPSAGFSFTLKTATPQTSSATPSTDVATINEEASKKVTIASESASESESESEDEEIKVEGPTFTINTKPITKDHVFSFGPKKVAPKDDSDSESEVEIKGPEFTFSGTIKSDVFKLKPKEKDTEATEKTAGIFNTTEEKKTEDEKTAPIFSFGTNKTAANTGTENTSRSTFTFGASAATPASKPSFGFSFAKPAEPNTDSSEIKAATPSFSFGKSSKATENEAETSSKPTFTFNIASKVASEDNKEAGKKPAFNFTPSTASPSNTGTATQPSFQFGFKPSEVKDTEEAKPLSITTLTSSNDIEKAPESTSVSTEKVASAEQDRKPSFTFGQSSKPAFTFGQSSNNKDSTKPSFTFGQTSVNTAITDTKPSFGFRQTAASTSTTKTETETKPSFTFGKPASSTEEKSENKPVFSFGQGTSSNPAPSFSFAKPVAESDNSTVTPSGGFKFSLPFEQKTTEPTITDDQKKQDNDTEGMATDNATVDDESKNSTNENETSAPLDLQNGEEDEINLFSQRAKLMVFNSETKAYDSRGVGEMKLLQRKDDKTKIRLLCRSDGMGNILLNASVVKSFTYTPLTAENENLVKTPTVGSDGKLTTYIVKFKQKSDGRSFIKSIEDAKKDM